MSAPFQPFIFHNWEVLEPRESGLHGQVYLVRHRHTGDPFALKMMHLQDLAVAGRVRRSLSTAKANYRIRHANIVAVHDLGCEDDGRVWVLMEWLEGRSVANHLALLGGRFSVPMALHVAIEIAWGVDAAHEHGTIHRDLKPDNVWLTPTGQVKVLDFSLAKVIPEGIATTVQLGASIGMGTLPFLAPEGLRPDAVADARIDIYALGLSLWQMIAGRHAFQDALRNTAELIRRQLYVDPEPLSTVARLPAYVDEFMKRALAKNPDQRFSTMAEMARALMTLRDRLRSDVEQGLVTLTVPRGEPPVPGGDPWTRRDYSPPREAPEQLRPKPTPAERVMVKEHGEAPQRPARRGPTALRTQPLPAGMGTPPAPPDVAPAPPRETSPAVSRETPPQRQASRTGPLVAVVLAVAAIAAVATGLWYRRSVAPASSAPAAEVTLPSASSPAVIAPTASPSPSSPAAQTTTPAASGTAANAAGASSSRTRRPAGPPAWPSPAPVSPSRRPFGIEH